MLQRARLGGLRALCAFLPSWTWDGFEAHMELCASILSFSSCITVISHFQRAQAGESSPSLACMPHRDALQEGTKSGKTLVHREKRDASAGSSQLSLLSAHLCTFAPRQGDPWDSQGAWDSCLLQMWVSLAGTLLCMYGWAVHLPSLSSSSLWWAAEFSNFPVFILSLLLEQAQDWRLLLSRVSPAPGQCIRCYCNTNSRTFLVSNECLACRDMRTLCGLYPTL